MRVLITGACGFVGRKLAAELAAHGHELTLLTHTIRELPVNGRAHRGHPCDVRDSAAVRAAVLAARPQAIAHLAGLAQIVDAARDREQMAAVNSHSVSHVAAAASVLAQKQPGLAPIPVLFTSSSFVYGDAFRGPHALSEESPLRPTTPYGESKLAGESLGRCYDSELVRFYSARPFNHIGPGQSPSFVCPGLARRVRETPNGGTIAVGNLASQRDFCDVRDIVRAYRLILEKRPEERVFVLGSGQPVSVETVLATLLEIAGKKVATKVDPDLYRDGDLHVLSADTRLAAKVLGWQAKIPLAQSLGDLYRDLAGHDKL